MILQYAPGVQREASVTVSGRCSVDLSPTVAAPQGSQVIRVSYAQGDYPLMSVYNSIGAPLVPFIADVSV